MQTAQSPVTTYVGYGLAVVIGVAAFISGVVTGAGVVAGAGIGWVAAASLLVVTHQQAHVEGEDDTFFAIFDVSSPWLWLVAVVLIAAGAAIGGPTFAGG